MVFVFVYPLKCTYFSCSRVYECKGFIKCKRLERDVKRIGKSGVQMLKHLHASVSSSNLLLPCTQHLLNVISIKPSFQWPSALRFCSAEVHGVAAPCQQQAVPLVGAAKRWAERWPPASTLYQLAPQSIRWAPGEKCCTKGKADPTCYAAVPSHLLPQCCSHLSSAGQIQIFHF